METPSGKFLPGYESRIFFSIWEAAAEGIDCGDEVAEWITRYLRARTPLRLLYRSRRVSGKDFNPGMKKLLKMTGTSTVNSDAVSFTLAFVFSTRPAFSVVHRVCSPTLSPIISSRSLRSTI